MRLHRLVPVGALLVSGVIGCGGSDEGYKAPTGPVVATPLDKDLQAQLERQIHTKVVKKTSKTRAHR